MTSRRAVGMSAPSVNADVARLECQPTLTALGAVRWLNSSAMEKTKVLHLTLRFEDNNIALVKLLLEDGASAKQKLGQNSETALHVAAKHCTDPGILRYLLDAGVTLNATTRPEKLTALHMAVEKNNRLAVEELLSRGVRVDAQSRVGDTALHMAVKLESEELVRLLLDHGANPNCQNDVEETPFTCSLGRDRDRFSRLMLRKTVEKPVNACLKNHAGETALHLAALRCSSVEVFKSLLKLSHSNVTNDSALLFNAIKNTHSSVRMKMIRLLLKLGGTDPRKIVNKRGETLFYQALLSEAMDVAVYLLKSQKVDINGKPGRKIPLFHALRCGDEAVVNQLLKLGARADLVDRQTCNQSTLQAAIVGFEEKGALFRVCKLLLDRGAPLDHLDSTKNTALYKALIYDHERLADLLIARGANVHLKAPGGGRSPLHIACMKGLINVAKKLLDAGANVNDVNDIGESVLTFATFSNSKEVVKLILDYGADCRTDGGALVSAATHRNTNLEILKLLLSRGADVNLQTHGRVPLAHTIDLTGPSPTNSGFVKGYLVEQIALLAAQGVPIHQQNLELIDRFEHFKTFYDRCFSELQIMKSTRPCQEYPVSYFDLLTKRHHGLVRCFLCEKVRLGLQKDWTNDNLKFLFYLNDMKTNCNLGLRRLSMLMKLQELLQDVLKDKLPSELIEMLGRYFSDKEMEGILR